MATKNEIANDIYGVDYVDLESSERAAVDMEFNDASEDEDETPRAAGIASVKFGRPGVNGVKESFVAAGTSVSAAALQAGMNVRADKESFQIKESAVYETGQTLSATDIVNDGDVILVVTGVDSAY